MSPSSLSSTLPGGDTLRFSSFGTLRVYELATSALQLSVLHAGLSCGDDGGDAVLLLNLPEAPCSDVTDCAEASLWLSVNRAMVDF